MSDAILIVGGYGAVGAVIASQLAPQHADQLIIAGRNAYRAAQFAAKLGVPVRWRVVDVSKPVDYDALLDGVRYVVMCLDLPNTEFARQCFERGIHYIDISAEYPVLSAIAQLNQVARQYGATAVLSVGLVPGLSNLMARHSLKFVYPIEHFDSAIVAGLGEKHGVSGSSWILQHFTEGTGKARFQFRQPYGEKVVYPFAFSDQYTLTQTLPIASATTWLGFESVVMTRLIGLARLPLLRTMFRGSTMKRLLLTTTQRFQFGSEEFVLTTVARGAGGSFQAWLRGEREARLTGLVAAEVVRRITTERFPAGVFHIEQLFTLDEFLPLLAQHNVRFGDSHEQVRAPVASALV